MWPSTSLTATGASFGKKPCSLAVPLITGQKNADFLKQIVFRPFLGPTGVLFAVCALVVISRDWDGTLRSQLHQKKGGQMQLGLHGKPKFEQIGAVWHIWPYSQIQWPYSVMQAGASPGSSVGNKNNWILFLWCIVDIPCLCFRSATSYSGKNTQKHCFLTHKKCENTKLVLEKSANILGRD